MIRVKGLKGVISWLSAFLFAVAVIAVYKTFDNFDSIWAFVGTILDILSPFVTGFGLALLLFAPSRARATVSSARAPGPSPSRWCIWPCC